MIWIKNFYFIQIVSGAVLINKLPETNMNFITTPSPLRIAVIGGGISGMGAAYQLSNFGKVTLFLAKHTFSKITYLAQSGKKPAGQPGEASKIFVI